MKKFMLSSLAVAALCSAVIFTSSFTPANTVKIENVYSNIDFKVVNNTGGEFKYCVNGGHNYINSGSTKSFSYAVGQTFYYVEGSNCGKQWFKVTSDMQGKTFKVTDLK